MRKTPLARPIEKRPLQVAIVIQARSTSKRFPRKVFEYVGKKRVLDHVLDVAFSSASYVNKFNFYSSKREVEVSVCLAVPFHDEIKDFFKRPNLTIIEGPEDDVLTRYTMSAVEMGADFVVRLTADCCFLVDNVISKHISLAISEGYDYVTNADSRCRTSYDGLDVEVMSRRALEWLNQNAITPDHREHVTVLLREKPPSWAEMCHVNGTIDLSHIKVSMDTADGDKPFIEDQMEKVTKKKILAKEIYKNVITY